MKLLRVASLMLIIGFATSANAQQAASPAPTQAIGMPTQKATQATATADARQSNIDPEELKARTREHLTYLFQYSMTLPEKERQPYTDLMFAGGLMMHKMDLGQISPETLDAKIKELEKFYEDDRKLTPKEAEKFKASITPLVTLR